MYHNRGAGGLPRCCSPYGLPALTGVCGARGAGALPALKRRKLERGADPLKGGFVRAPKRGGNEPLTAAEAAAEEAGRKAARKAARKAGPATLLKRNERKKR